MSVIEYLMQLDDTEVVTKVMELCRCEERTLADAAGHYIDGLFDSLKTTMDRMATLEKILTLIFEEAVEETYPVVGLVKSELLAFWEEDISAIDIADNLGVSRYWLKYCFERETGMTIEECRRELRASLEKTCL